MWSIKVPENGIFLLTPIFFVGESAFLLLTKPVDKQYSSYTNFANSTAFMRGFRL